MRTWIAVAAAYALLAGADARASTWVVAIGNDQGLPTEPPLAYAARDAEVLLDVFRKLARIAPEEAILATGGDAESVRGLLLRTNARIRAAQGDNSAPEHALIVYYSGHADASSLHLGSTQLSLSELKSIVESSPARVRVLILDACRSGGVTRKKGVKPAQPFVIQLEDQLKAKGFAIITSSSDSEDSQESEELRASFFTHHLVNALRGAADRDRDKRVTLGEAYAYAYQETLRSTGRTLTVQHPTYLYDLSGAGDVVLTHLSDVQRAGVLAIAEPGAYLLFERDETGPLAADITVAAEGAELVLAPGRYFVQRRSESSYREIEVDLAPNMRVDLASLPSREVAYARLVRKGGARRSAHAFVLAGGVDGATTFGRGVAPGVLAGYAIDLPWLTAGMHAHWSRARSDSSELGVAHDRLGLRARAERFVDLDVASVSLGLFVEGMWHRQSFDTRAYAPSRSGFGVGLGLFAAAEVEVLPALSLRVEGGPVTEIYRGAVLKAGAIAGDELVTPLTYFGALGVVWRH
jgi:hypothetical protein